MKRNLIALAAIVLSLGTTAAVADNNYVFDDPYWKRAESAPAFQSVQSTEGMAETRGAYDLVDKYNP